MKKTDPTKRRTQSQRAGLVFPVGNISNRIRKYTKGHRLSCEVPVVLTAIMESLVTRLIRSLVVVVQNDHKKRISNEHIQICHRTMPEFSPFINRHVIFTSQGWSENNTLLPKTRRLRLRKLQKQAAEQNGATHSE